MSKLILEPSEALYLVTLNRVENKHRNICGLSFFGTREATAAYLKKEITSLTEPEEFEDVKDFSGDDLVRVAQDGMFMWFCVKPIWLNEEI